MDMVGIARTRIGRIRMKDGGADLHILNLPVRSVIENHMRSWVANTLGLERPPDAYAAVAFWLDADRPGRPQFSATFCTRHDALTAPLLVRVAGAYLVAEQAASMGAAEAVEAMGGEVEDWSPDDAS